MMNINLIGKADRVGEFDVAGAVDGDAEAVWYEAKAIGETEVRVEAEVETEIESGIEVVESGLEELEEVERLVEEEVRVEELVEEKRLVDDEVRLEELDVEDAILDELVEDVLARTNAARAANVRMEVKNMMKNARR
jgi:hypothetical protein